MDLGERLAELPDRLKPARAANLLLGAIAAFFLLFVVWAALSEIDEVSGATGRVVPARSLQVVSNLEGGIVGAILVHQGERVSAGQPLIQLEPVLADAQFLESSESAGSLAARAARLEAETSGRPLRFPAGLATEPAAAERSLYAARRADLAATQAMASARLRQATEAEAGAKAEMAAKREAKLLADREVTLIAPLVDKGVEPAIVLVRARSQAAQTGGDAAAAAANVARGAAAAAEARAQLRSVRETFDAKAVEDLAKTRGELAALRQTLPALRDKLSRTAVRAPLAGIVNRVLVATTGGIVRPGEPLVEIVPAADRLVVEAQLSPKDVAFVREGQKATIKLTAYEFSVYGGLPGRVESISPDAVLDPRTGEGHYLVRVRTDGPLLSSAGRKLTIAPGMAAQISILGAKRSVLSYLFSPIAHVTGEAFRER